MIQQCRIGGRWGAALVAAVAALLCGAPAHGQNFAWLNDGTAAPGITPAIFLRDNNVQAVDAFLAAQSVKAVRIDSTLLPETIRGIFGKYRVDYTFIDYETPDATARAATLVGQIRATAATGPALLSGKAWISNFNYTPLSGDVTSPASTSTASAYSASGMNMAAPELYPGSPSYRGPASGNSTSPNVRSALFTLPIERLTQTTSSLAPGQINVPYINRFNNWGNSALDSDGDWSNGFQFVTANQLLSRGDFSAQVLHYRLRGAQAVQGLDGGVVGYTQDQFEADINRGWNGRDSINQIFADPQAKPATLDVRVKADGRLSEMENTGVVWSGAYSLDQGKLVLLLSNLDESAHTVGLPWVIGGMGAGQSYAIPAGTHEILEFGLSGSKWVLASSEVVFADADRGGVGVPEPVGAGLIGGLLALLACRRRRA